eukprot:1151234-Pelagomonas_calceolata.AAC.8
MLGIVSLANLACMQRDGMNLVSYEYVACQSDNAGVLVLSEFAGACRNRSQHVWTPGRFGHADLEQALDLAQHLLHSCPYD